jgi:hypothetical protein
MVLCWWNFLQLGSLELLFLFFCRFFCIEVMEAEIRTFQRGSIQRPVIQYIRWKQGCERGHIEIDKYL